MRHVHAGGDTVAAANDADGVGRVVALLHVVAQGRSAGSDSAIRSQADGHAGHAAVGQAGQAQLGAQVGAGLGVPFRGEGLAEPAARVVQAQVVEDGGRDAVHIGCHELARVAVVPGGAVHIVTVGDHPDNRDNSGARREAVLGADVVVMLHPDYAPRVTDVVALQGAAGDHVGQISAGIDVGCHVGLGHVLQQLLRHRVQHGRRNDVAGERYQGAPGGGADDVELVAVHHGEVLIKRGVGLRHVWKLVGHALQHRSRIAVGHAHGVAEVAGAHGVGRHQAVSLEKIAAVAGFDAEEEERVVAAIVNLGNVYRAAGGKGKLVGAGIGHRPVGEGGGERRRVGGGVALIP